MANEKPPAGGQQKVHIATRVNPAGETEQREFTQEQWRNRDKAEGWTRPDADEGETDEAPTPA